ncbi:MAG TPA: SPOR domain-containing protein [Bacteroidota bacterium]|nr:SPOR domain-containing protein [Bacteroidota bacterium]
MNIVKLPACVIAAAASLIFIGCSSSSSTQNEGGAAAQDTAALQAGQSSSPQQSRNFGSRRSGDQEGFVTQEDTIEAEVVTRNHDTHRAKPLSKSTSKKKFYSVQIGAFRQLSNADRAQKVAKERYKKTIYQFYDKPIKMYRVTIGHFSKLKDGLAFRKKIQKERPKEYKDAWVAEMRR